MANAHIRLLQIHWFILYNFLLVVMVTIVIHCIIIRVSSHVIIPVRLGRRGRKRGRGGRGEGLLLLHSLHPFGEGVAW